MERQRIPFVNDIDIYCYKKKHKKPSDRYSRPNRLLPFRTIKIILEVIEYYFEELTTKIRNEQQDENDRSSSTSSCCL